MRRCFTAAPELLAKGFAGRGRQCPPRWCKKTKSQREARQSGNRATLQQSSALLLRRISRPELNYRRRCLTPGPNQVWFWRMVT